MRKFVTLGILGLLGLGVASAAAADDTRPRRQRGVVVLEPTEIVGRRQIPVEFILVRTDTGYQLVEQRTSFVHEVVRSVGGEAF